MCEKYFRFDFLKFVLQCPRETKQNKTKGFSNKNEYKLNSNYNRSILQKSTHAHTKKTDDNDTQTHTYIWIDQSINPFILFTITN